MNKAYMNQRMQNLEHGNSTLRTLNSGLEKENARLRNAQHSAERRAAKWKRAAIAVAVLLASTWATLIAWAAGAF